MESLHRLVTDSLARHGFESPRDLRPLEWSRWFRCESSFSLLLVPSAPGIYALGEEIVAPGEVPGGRRMLAVFEVAETDDLCITLSRHFAPRSPLSSRLSTGRCFVRFAEVRDLERRGAACDSLQLWLAASAHTATGLAGDLCGANDFSVARDVPQPGAVRDDNGARNAAQPNAGEHSQPISSVHQAELDTAASGDEPPPLPAGF